MGTGVYPAQGEAQGAWGTQPLEEKVKVEQGLFFAEIAAFNYEREVIEMAEDMTKGKEETVTSCCTANSNQGKMPKAVHNNRLHRRFPGDTQQNSRTEGSLCQS